MQSRDIADMKLIYSILAASAVFSGGAVSAQEVCGALQDILSYVSATDEDKPEVPSPPFAGGDCVAAGDNFQCRWDFALRAPGVETMFAFVVDAVPMCYTDSAVWPEDQPVNHPDSYTLKRFDAGGGVISIATKDKTQLNRSYIFLRVDAMAQE